MAKMHYDPTRGRSLIVHVSPKPLPLTVKRQPTRHVDELIKNAVERKMLKKRRYKEKMKHLPEGVRVIYRHKKQEHECLVLGHGPRFRVMIQLLDSGEIKTVHINEITIPGEDQ